MSKQKTTSDVGDLSLLMKDIKKAFKRRGFGEAALVIAFTLPPHYNTAHWCSNIDRTSAAMILRATADKIVMKSN